MRAIAIAMRLSREAAIFSKAGRLCFVSCRVRAGNPRLCCLYSIFRSFPDETGDMEDTRVLCDVAGSFTQLFRYACPLGQHGSTKKLSGIIGNKKKYCRLPTSLEVSLVDSSARQGAEGGRQVFGLESISVAFRRASNFYWPSLPGNVSSQCL